MKITPLFAVLPLLALAACGSGGGNASNPAAPVAGKTAPAGTNWTEVVSATPEGGMRMGNPDAPIKLIEYGSRTCPVCGAFGREGTQPLEKNYIATGKVSWEFREFLVHGQPDIPAALLGTCVPNETFFPILEQMFVNQGPVEEKLGSPQGQALFQKFANAPRPIDAAGPWADLLGYVEFFKQRGLPEDKLRACLADTKKLDALLAGMRTGESMGVKGTPAFFINGKMVDAINWQQLEVELKAAGG